MRDSHKNYINLKEAIIAFAQVLRREGLEVGLAETQAMLLMSKEEVLSRKKNMLHASKAICCTRKEDLEKFDLLFEHFWGGHKMQVNAKTTYRNESNLQKKSKATLVWMGMGEGNSDEEKEEAQNVSGANAIDRLRQTDFTKVAEMDEALLEELAMKLFKQMSLRLKRKTRYSKNKGKIDLRRTIRGNLSNGGELINLIKKRKDISKRRLVILLDVSGSMDKYSFFLLRFVWALRQHFERIEAFIFSTRLIQITEYLQNKDLPQTLATLSRKAHNWSGGTQIGLCLRDFNEQYAKEVLSRKSITIVLSDGLDTGKPEILAEEMVKIKRRTRSLIWLNPLKGMTGYEPIARGMSAALPQVDVFNSAHNLNSLLELENYLMNV